MKLSDAINKDYAIVVISPEGGTRYAAEVFIVSKGIVFLDIGWDQSSTHAIHLVEGISDGELPIKVDDAEVRLITEDDSVIDDMLMWKSYRSTPEGWAATREAAKRYMETTYQEN